MEADITRHTPTGTQTISRAHALLAELAREGGSPKRITDVARRLGLTEPTTARILRGLEAVGLAARDRPSTSWVLGPEITALAAARTSVPRRFWATVDGSLLHLVETFGVSASLWMKSKRDLVCVRRMDGVRAPEWNSDHLGNRHPLTEGAGGAALLSAMPSATRTQQHDHSAVSQGTSAETHCALNIACSSALSAAGHLAFARAIDPESGADPLGVLVLTQRQSDDTADRRAAIEEALTEECRRLSYAISRPYDASLR